MQQLESERAQAVLFFGTDGIVKELLFTEFEALLEGMVPTIEWANQTRKAAYLEVNCHFTADAAVFFTMDFNSKGEVDAAWNLPLMDMARTVSKGPDLGTGPIRMACKSQCPVAYYKEWLWDPVMDPDSGHFGQIKKALKRNRLGIQFKAEDDEPDGGGFSKKDVKALEENLSKKLSRQYDKELKDQMAQLLKDQRLMTSTMNTDKDSAVKELQASLNQTIESLQAQLETKGCELSDALKRNEELKETIEGQVQKIEGLREYFEHKLSRVNGGESDAIESIAEQHKTEIEARVQSATRELNERLRMKELELTYRVEHEDKLKEQLQQLRESTKDVFANSGDQVLETLSQKGVNFVTYQPGAGHITIPVPELTRFLESPIGFTADYCGISEQHYASWLKHYQAPVCTALEHGGKLCCENLPRVVVPAEFVKGDSDRCERHNISNTMAKKA